MADLTPFDLYFMERYPAEAADVLEGLDPAEVAASLATSLAGTTPEATGAVVAELEPAFAADCLEFMPPEALAQLMTALDDATVTALLRGFPTATRKTVLTGMPPGRARAVDRRLRFAAGTVGAWMEGTSRTFGAATQVATCLGRLRKAQGDAQALIVLTDSANKFVGAVTLTRLIAADDKTRLRDLIDPTIHPLHQNMPIDAAADNPTWRRHGALPVVDADGEVVGELTHERLTQALSGAEAMEAMRPPASIVANLGHAYLLSLRGFAGLGEAASHHPRETNDV